MVPQARRVWQWVASPWASFGAVAQAESLPSIWLCLLAIELFNILMSPFFTSSTGSPWARWAGGRAVGEVVMNINEAALCLVCLLNVPSHQDGAGLGGALLQRPHGHAILKSPGSSPVWGGPWGA